MPNYRRYRVPGGTFFFTVNLADRNSDLLVLQINVLRAVVREVRRRRAFVIDAWVVLPDHMHCIWTLPENDTNYSARWWEIKMGFSKALPREGVRQAGEAGHKGRGIWQKRFWEHTIRDERDYAAHMDFVHFNLVKHGLAENAAEWPFSTFGRCVRAGMYPVGWVMGREAEGAFGERSLEA